MGYGGGESHFVTTVVVTEESLQGLEQKVSTSLLIQFRLKLIGTALVRVTATNVNNHPSPELLLASSQHEQWRRNAEIVAADEQNGIPFGTVKSMLRPATNQSNRSPGRTHEMTMTSSASLCQSVVPASSTNLEFSSLVEAVEDCQTCASYNGKHSLNTQKTSDMEFDSDVSTTHNAPVVGHGSVTVGKRRKKNLKKSKPVPVQVESEYFFTIEAYNVRINQSFSVSVDTLPHVASTVVIADVKHNFSELIPEIGLDSYGGALWVNIRKAYSGSYFERLQLAHIMRFYYSWYRRFLKAEETQIAEDFRKACQTQACGGCQLKSRVAIEELIESAVGEGVEAMEIAQTAFELHFCMRDDCGKRLLYRGDYRKLLRDAPWNEVVFRIQRPDAVIRVGRGKDNETPYLNPIRWKERDIALENRQNSKLLKAEQRQYESSADFFQHSVQQNHALTHENIAEIRTMHRKIRAMQVIQDNARAKFRQQKRDIESKEIYDQVFEETGDPIAAQNAAQEFRLDDMAAEARKVRKLLRMRLNDKYYSVDKRYCPRCNALEPFLDARYRHLAVLQQVDEIEKLCIRFRKESYNKTSKIASRVRGTLTGPISRLRAYQRTRSADGQKPPQSAVQSPVRPITSSGYVETTLMDPLTDRPSSPSTPLLDVEMTEQLPQAGRSVQRSSRLLSSRKDSDDDDSDVDEGCVFVGGQPFFFTTHLYDSTCEKCNIPFAPRKKIRSLQFEQRQLAHTQRGKQRHELSNNKPVFDTSEELPWEWKSFKRKTTIAGTGRKGLLLRNLTALGAETALRNLKITDTVQSSPVTSKDEYFPGEHRNSMEQLYPESYMSSMLPTVLFHSENLINERRELTDNNCLNELVRVPSSSSSITSQKSSPIISRRQSTVPERLADLSPRKPPPPTQLVLAKDLFVERIVEERSKYIWKYGMAGAFPGEILPSSVVHNVHPITSANTSSVVQSTSTTFTSAAFTRVCVYFDTSDRCFRPMEPIHIVGNEEYFLDAEIRFFFATACKGRHHTAVALIANPPQAVSITGGNPLQTTPAHGLLEISRCSYWCGSPKERKAVWRPLFDIQSSIDESQLSIMSSFVAQLDSLPENNHEFGTPAYRRSQATRKSKIMRAMSHSTVSINSASSVQNGDTHSVVESTIPIPSGAVFLVNKVERANLPAEIPYLSRASAQFFIPSVSSSANHSVNSSPSAMNRSFLSRSQEYFVYEFIFPVSSYHPETGDEVLGSTIIYAAEVLINHYFPHWSGICASKSLSVPDLLNALKAQNQSMIWTRDLSSVLGDLPCSMKASMVTTSGVLPMELYDVQIFCEEFDPN